MAMWHDADGMGWWMLWGSLMFVLFWGGIIALVVWLVQSATRRGDGTMPPPSADPLDIAKARYARGEISREEFEQIRQALA